MIKLDLTIQTLQRLEQLVGKRCFNFLGYTLDLQKSILTDNLKQSSESLSQQSLQILTILLKHYSLATAIPLTGKLVKFRDIPGGYAYEDAFTKRAIQPVAEVFGENPEELSRAAKLLCGIQLKLGDASAEILSLKGVPLTYILWSAGEYEASANILYDESASNYLPTEDLAVLGEITSLRLIQAKENYEKNQSKE